MKKKLGYLGKRFNLSPAQLEEVLKQLSENTGYTEGEIISSAICLVVHYPDEIHNIISMKKLYEAALIHEKDTENFLRRLEVVQKSVLLRDDNDA